VIIVDQSDVISAIAVTAAVVFQLCCDFCSLLCTAFIIKRLNCWIW